MVRGQYALAVGRVIWQLTRLATGRNQDVVRADVVEPHLAADVDNMITSRVSTYTDDSTTMSLSAHPLRHGLTPQPAHTGEGCYVTR